MSADAASASEVSALADSVKEKFSRLDIAVTTPGLNIRKTILDYTEEDLSTGSSTSTSRARYISCARSAASWWTSEAAA